MQRHSFYILPSFSQWWHFVKLQYNIIAKTLTFIPSYSGFPSFTCTHLYVCLLITKVYTFITCVDLGTHYRSQDSEQFQLHISLVLSLYNCVQPPSCLCSPLHPYSLATPVCPPFLNFVLSLKPKLCPLVFITNTISVPIMPTVSQALRQAPGSQNWIKKQHGTRTLVCKRKRQLPYWGLIYSYKYIMIIIIIPLYFRKDWGLPWWPSG